MSNTHVCRSAIAGLIQTSQYLGKPVAALPNSTLNQKLNINADQDITSADMPTVKYIAIGIGGHGFELSGSNVLWKEHQHQPDHAGLYKQIPFVLRTLDNDLTATERANFRLRRIEEHDGISYVAYYLYVLDTSNSDVILERRTVVDGTTTAVAYTPKLSDLSPTYVDLSTGSSVTTSGDYVASSCKVPFELTPAMVQDIINVCEIIYNDARVALLSEMATVSGVDATVSGLFNGVTKQYTDVLRAQITSFISCGYILDYMNDGITLRVDIGNVEPLRTAG